MYSMTSWVSFKIGDLFERVDVKKIKENAIEFSKEKTKEATIPLITASGKNQGISRYARHDQCPTILKNVLTISANGRCGTTFYQPEEIAILQDAYAIKLKDENTKLTRQLGLFLATILTKTLEYNFDYGNKSTWNKVKDIEIKLPAKEVNEPDWKYMEDYIKELEGYLQSAGLDNYELTEEEVKALSIYAKDDVERKKKKLDTSNWKKFKLEDLFESIVGDVDLQKRDFTEQGTPVISAGVTNNGVAGYTEKEARIIPENTITVDMFGNVRYRDFKYKLATHGRIFALKSKTDLPENVGLFLEAILSKHLVNFNYSRMCSWNKIKDIEIKLPAIETEEPDWKYMEDYIKELEQDYIKELEGYLQSAGLDNYELTEEEVKALSIYAKDDVERKKKKLDTSNWKKFKLEDLFDIKTTKSANKNKIKVINKGTFEFIGRSSVNNGVQGYVEKLGYEPNEENTLSIVQVGKTCCLYRDKKWYASQNIFKLIPKFDHLNKIHYFITTIIDKNLIYYEPAYVCPKLSDLKDLEIELPISSTIDPTHKYHPEGYIPDWQFIETYMKALEKTVIKEVVDYKNDFINKAKEVISTEKKEIF